MSRYESLIALRDRATARGELSIAQAVQKLIDNYYNHTEPHKEEKPKKWYSRLWAWLTEAY